MYNNQPANPNMNYPVQQEMPPNPNNFQPYSPQQDFQPSHPNNFQPNMAPPPGPGGETESNLIQSWPRNTIYVKCLSCRQRGYTRVSRSFSTTGIVVFLLLFFFCIYIFPIAFIVFCIDSFYMSKHYCAHCGAYFGSSEGN